MTDGSSPCIPVTAGVHQWGAMGQHLADRVHCPGQLDNGPSLALDAVARAAGRAAEAAHDAEESAGCAEWWDRSLLGFADCLEFPSLCFHFVCYRHCLGQGGETPLGYRQAVAGHFRNSSQRVPPWGDPQTVPSPKKMLAARTPSVADLIHMTDCCCTGIQVYSR